ncbi:hypothetical protein [Laspinema olomoucense]|uniref:hypothetical protein n=1 Tax=Laspinema olomoucense TaxID=3231600 RepID=UPI0021BA55FA|nr:MULTISPECIES: hypothetical protein [unclassified Laspinema]MCT7970876.1 hypothetical protein [Laspinema sp. D3d]MCT7993822.1 hypothetical protein [Laspinema sp. D3c]
MFPSKRFTMTTYLSPEEVLKKLSEVVTPTSNPIQFRWRRSKKPYQGQIAEHSFKIYRVIYNRNSFLPEIEGQIQAHGRGSQIKIEIKLHPFVIIFMSLWLIMLAVVALMILGEGLFKEIFNLAFLMPMGMLILGLALPRIAFFPEAKKSQKFLLELFQGQEDN